MPPKQDSLFEVNKNIQDYLKRHFYHLLTADAQKQVQSRQFVQILISKLDKQQVSPSSNEARWLYFLKQVLNRIKDISLLKAYYASFTHSPKALAQQHAIEVGMRDLINQLAQDWEGDDEYRRFCLKQPACQQAVTFLFFYYCLHESQFDVRDSLKSVVNHIRQQWLADHPFRQVMDYLYFLKVINVERQYTQVGGNHFITFDQLVTAIPTCNQVITARQLREQSQLAHKVLNSDCTSNYIAQYIKYLNLTIGTVFILDNYHDIDEISSRIWALNEGWGVIQSAQGQSYAEMFEQVLKNQSYFYQLLNSLNLLQYPDYLLNPVRQKQFHEPIYKFHQYVLSNAHKTDSAKQANQNLLAVLDSHIATMYYNNISVENESEFNLVKNLFVTLKQNILPLLNIQHKQFSVLFLFIERFYDAVDSGCLDSFLIELKNKNYKEVDYISSSLEQYLPTISKLLVACLQTLLMRLYQLRPPETVQESDKLQGIIMVYQTARLFHALLNAPFMPESQQRLYLRQQFQYDLKEGCNTSKDNLASFEFIIYTLLQTNVQCLLLGLEPENSQGIVENIEGLEEGIKQADYHQQHVTRDLLSIYQQFFQSIHDSVQLRQAYQSKDKEKIVSHKQHLNAVMANIEKSLRIWGFCNQAQSLQAKFLLNSQIGQQLLLFFLYCDYKYPNRLFSNLWIQGIARRLYQAATSNHLKTVVNYLYYRKTQTPLAQENDLIEFYDNLPFLAKRNDAITRLIQYLENILQINDDSIPFYVVRDIQAYFIIQSFYYLDQNNSRRAQNFLDNFKLDNLDCPKKPSCHRKLLNVIAWWLQINDSLNLSLDSQDPNINSAPYELINQFQRIALGKSNKQRAKKAQIVRDNNTMIGELLQRFDSKVRWAYAEAEKHQACSLSNWVVIDTIITYQVMPLLELKYGYTQKQNPLKLLQSLQNACDNSTDDGHNLMSFDTSKWTFSSPEVAIFCSCKLPNVTHYIIDALREIILRLYEDKPPQADMARQDVVQIMQLYNLCSYVCHLLGGSWNLPDLDLESLFDEYVQKVGLTQVEIESSSLECQNVRSEYSIAKRTKSAQGQSLKSHNDSIQDNSPKDRSTSESTSGSSNLSHKDAPSTRVISESQRFYSECDDKQSSTTAFINTDQLPHLLRYIAYWLFEAEMVQLVLTGSAVPAYYRGQPDKVRDHDCLAVVDDIDRIKDVLKLNGCVDIDNQTDSDKQNDGKVTVRLVKANHPIVVINKDQDDVKIEISTVKPELGKTHEQVLHQNMGDRVTVSDALFVNLTHSLYREKLPIEGARAGCKALDQKQIRLVLPEGQAYSIKQRLVDDPVRLLRLAKFKQTFDDLQPNEGLVNGINRLIYDPVWSARLLSQASQFTHQLGTAIEDMFQKLTNDQVVQSLLDDQMPILAALTRLPHDQLKCCQAIWIDYLNKAETSDCYDKKFRLFQCLLVAYCELNSQDEVQDCDLFFFYNVKKTHYKVMNSIINQYLDKPLYSQSEMTAESYALAKTMHQCLSHAYSHPPLSQHNIHNQSTYNASLDGHSQAEQLSKPQ